MKKPLAWLALQLALALSKIAREVLGLLAAFHASASQPRITGLGRFLSGLPDLGSNKKHLRNFGQ